MGPSGRITHVIGYVGLYSNCLGQDMQVLYLGRALRTKGDSARFSKVASGNLTSTCIPRVDG